MGIKNILLLIFDTLILPITLIRIVLIYCFGSRYGIDGFDFFDIIMHAENKYFNQQEDKLTVDTIDSDIRTSINKASCLDDIPIQHTVPIVERNFTENRPTILENKNSTPVETIINEISIAPNIFIKHPEQNNNLNEELSDEENEEKSNKKKLLALLDIYKKKTDSDKTIGDVLKNNVDKVIEDEISQLDDLMHDNPSSDNDLTNNTSITYSI